jgi:uncharacterized integral membrane protein
MPRTRLGWWSIGLAATFVVLFVVWLLYVEATPMARPTFFSDPLHAVLILGAAAAAITGAIVGALALAARRERSSPSSWATKESRVFQDRSILRQGV